MNSSEGTVYIIDDDASVCRSLSRLVTLVGMEAICFSSAEEFLQAKLAPLRRPSCVVLDLHMPGLGGLELQRELAAGPAPSPVIFISGNGDIPATVQAMRQGAVTFLSKPFEKDEMLHAIAEALERHRLLLASGSEIVTIQERFNKLTEREREVMAWVITGALNKQIAEKLGLTERTVKAHRGKVMEKTQVASIADLVRLCMTAGFKPADA